MKRSTAVRHLWEMAEECTDLNARCAVIDSTLRVTSFWAFGPVIDPPETWPGDREWVDAAIAVTLPEAELPWFGRPREVVWLASLLRWDRRPVLATWRADQVPVWNHHVERPLLLWDAAGLRPAAGQALGDGIGLEQHRTPAPTAAALRERLEREIAVSREAMSRAAAGYDEHRWGRVDPRKYAEPLWEATAGYLDLLGATGFRTGRREDSADP